MYGSDFPRRLRMEWAASKGQMKHSCHAQLQKNGASTLDVATRKHAWVSRSMKCSIRVQNRSTGSGRRSQAVATNAIDRATR